MIMSIERRKKGEQKKPTSYHLFTMLGKMTQKEKSLIHGQNEVVAAGMAVAMLFELSSVGNHVTITVAAGQTFNCLLRLIWIENHISQYPNLVNM